MRLRLVRFLLRLAARVNESDNPTRSSRILSIGAEISEKLEWS